MTSLNKKKKCSHTYLDRGGEKGSLFRMKREAMYHKKDRVAGKKLVNQSFELDDINVEPEPYEKGGEYMTNENVILILEQIRAHYDGTCKEALDRVISALSENKGDLISRQAVENITWEEPSYSDPLNVLTEVREKVRALPSVENKGEFDGMNNGEAMNLVLRKTFPRTIFIRGIDEYNKTKSIVYSEEWENAPYQKGGEK